MSNRSKGVDLHQIEQTVDAMPVPAWLTDPQGRMLHCNPAAVEYCGCEPESGELAKAFIRRLPAEPMQIMASAHATPIRDDAGHVVTVINCLGDFDRPAAREAALARAKERFARELGQMEQLYDLSTRLGAHADLDALLQEIVDAAVEITGTTMGNAQLLEPETGTLRLVAHRHFKEAYLEYFSSVVGGRAASGTAVMRGERVVVEDVTRSPIFDGTDAPGVMLEAGARAVQSTPMIGRSGRIVGILSTHYAEPTRPDEQTLRRLDRLARYAADLIERRQSEQREKARADELSALMEAVPALVFVARDPDATEITGNRTAHDVLRVPQGANLAPGAADGAPRRSRIRIDGHEVGSDEAPVQRAARGALAETFEEQIEFDDGGQIILFGHTVPLYDAEGRVRGALAAAVDITEQKQTQQRLEELNENLEERVATRTAQLQRRTTQLQHLANALSHAEQRERRKLAGTLHDDLQQILVAVKTQIWSLQRADGPARERIIRRLNGHIDDAIESTRSLSQQLSPRVLHRDGLAAALRWLASRREMHGLELAIEVDPEAEPTRDEVKLLLFQSVRELVLNAVKHAEVEKAWIAMHRAGDRSVCVTVSDEGAGFDPVQLERSDVGEGIGLFSIRERLEALGGRLEIDSTPGGGTSMRLFAPLHNDVLAADPEGTYTAPAAPEGGDARMPLRVLLAHACAATRQRLAQQLTETRDIDVVEAGSGAEAVAQAGRHRPQVVAIDSSVLEHDMAHDIRARCPDAGIIGLSVPEHGATAQLMRRIGAMCSLPREHSAEDLIEAVRRVPRDGGRIPA